MRTGALVSARLTREPCVDSCHEEMIEEEEEEQQSKTSEPAQRPRPSS